MAGLKDVDKFPWNEFVTWGSHPNSQFQPPGCHQFHQPMKDCETPSLEASPPQSVSVHQLLPARPGMRSWSRPSGRNVCQKKTGETDLCTYPLSKFQMEPLLKMSWEMSLPPWKMDTLRFHFAFPSVAVFHWRKPWRVLDGLDLVGPRVSLSIGILQAETGIKCSTYLNCQLQAPQQIHA